MGFGWFGFCYLFPILTFPLFLFFFMWINWVLKNILFYRHYYLINYTTLSVAVSLAFIVYIFNVACHQITWYHWLYLSSWTPKSLQMVAEVMKLKCLLFGKKAMTNLNSIFKSRDITLSTKVHIVKAMVFLVVMYGYESWTIKKAECWRIDAFELWCWRRLKSLELQRDQNSQS